MTTTHGPWGAGRPRLMLAGSDGEREFPLVQDRVRIGSAPANEIVLSGIHAEHAIIEHDDLDEYVLTLTGPGEMNARSISEITRSEVLRTGASFTVGEWTLVFMRDEHADHGRPFGGREGGEGSQQHLQNPRPDYRGRNGESASVRHDRASRGSSTDDSGGTEGEEFIAESELRDE